MDGSAVTARALARAVFVLFRGTRWRRFREARRESAKPPLDYPQRFLPSRDDRVNA